MFSKILNWFCKPVAKVYLWRWVEDRWGFCEAYSPEEAMKVALAAQKSYLTVDQASLRESTYGEVAYLRKAYSWLYSGEVVLAVNEK
jgi:hypothetical protein